MIRLDGPLNKFGVPEFKIYITSKSLFNVYNWNIVDCDIKANVHLYKLSLYYTAIFN